MVIGASEAKTLQGKRAQQKTKEAMKYFVSFEKRRCKIRNKKASLRFN